MRRVTTIEALMASALLLAGCGFSGSGDDPSSSSQAATTSAPSAPAIVSPALLDVGAYPTAPRPPLGAAGTPAAGVIADSQHMADFVIGPWDADETLIEPYLSTFYVLSATSVLQQLGPQTIADAAAANGFVDGFASARQVQDKTSMINAVMRFADPAAATAASVAMGDASAKQAVKGIVPVAAPIPGHPEAVASTYPFTPNGSDRARATVRSFTPHGPYVFMHFVQSVDGLDAATRLVAKAIDAQGPLIDQFTPADPAAFANVPLDPTGLLAKTLPGTAAMPAKNAVYAPRGAMHFQSNPVASRDLFKGTGTTEVAMGETNVYEARDPGAAADIIASFKREVGSSGTTPADPVKALPDSQCLAFPKGFYCVGPADRYAIEARGDQLLDAQQKLAAQYVMLTAT